MTPKLESAADLVVDVRTRLASLRTGLHDDLAGATVDEAFELLKDAEFKLREAGRFEHYRRVGERVARGDQSVEPNPN